MFERGMALLCSSVDAGSDMLEENVLSLISQF